MRGKFTGLLTMCLALQAHAELVPVQTMGKPEGVTQESTVPARSLTKRPRFIICGGAIPCAEATIKTLDNRHEEPVLVVQAQPAATAPAVTEKHEENADKAAKDALAEETKAAPAKDIDVSVRFDFGSAVLDHYAKSTLADLVMGQHKEGQDIRISGYTDAVGGKKINDRLARKRAEAVKTYLLRAGVEPSLIQIGSVSGKCCYAESNKTKAGRAANRRAEVKSSISVSIKE
ncbi:OmpA family protein [Thiobacillus denitrificans]|uniref:OmpA family protein n=1 Tax=Thiobacillus denitrificans TaxID=36861 RepID=UPI0009D998B0|nr:OmpA family protein [Thiobacillus denitrificans]